MAYVPAEGSYGAAAASAESVFHLDASHPDYVSVPDAELLFTGDFRRAGPDLVLTGRDGRHHIVPEYFSGATHPALVAPNGASLSAHLVDLLAGSPTPGQYAQAQSTAPADGIGKVEKVIGHVVVVRNGVAVALNVGDAVYKSDVIQTGANSSVGIDFPDGTALNLVANTRMALNEYSYDPDGHSNAALFSLVEGTFAFVAGKVAHTGDMKIETPVATMGIRGTTGFVQEQIGTITATVGNVAYSFAVADDYGSTSNGAYELVDNNPTSPTYGQIVALVSQTGFLTYVTPQGPNEPPLVTTQPITSAQLGLEQQIIQQIFQFLYQANPQSTPGSPGSSTPPPQPYAPLPQLIREDDGTTIGINVIVNGVASTGTASIVAFAPTPEATWTSGNGNWDDPSAWNDGIVPLIWQPVEIPLPVKVTVSDTEYADTLVIAAGATLNIVSGGHLIVENGIDNAGLIEINSSGVDPTLSISGTVLALSGGDIELRGSDPSQSAITGVAGTDATLINVNETIYGTGTIGSGDGSLLIVNDVDGTIEALNGTLILNLGNTVENWGRLEAGNNSVLLIEQGTIDNETAGVVEALNGSNIELQNATIEHGTVTIDQGGELSGFGTLQNLTLTNSGVIDANVTDETLTIATGNTVANYGTLEANDAILDVKDAVDGTGLATVGDHGVIEFESSVSADQTVTFTDATGTVALAAPAVFSALLAGLTVGDTIDLADISPSSITSALIEGSQLVVDETSDTTLSFNIAGNLTGNHFSLQSDGQGGSDLILSVNSGWTGDTLQETYFYPSSGNAYYTSPTFVVPASGVVANPDGGGVFSLSVDATSITASQFTFDGFWTPATFNGFEIVDLSGNPDISGVTIDAITNMTGLTASDISFGSDYVEINWEGLGFNPDTIVKLDITFDPPLDPSQMSVAQTLDGSLVPAVNTGILAVADGTELALAGVIDNTAAIAVNGATAATGIGIDSNVTLEGGGQIILSDSNENYVFGDGTLVNVDNTITGSGDLGNGTLTFDNAGIVETNGSYALIIDTGTNPFVNTGTLETDGGTLIVNSPVTGGGNAVITGGTLEFAVASDNNVSFGGSTGVLALDQSADFTGKISGFGGQDQIDLGDVGFSATTTLSYDENNSDSGGTLVVTDGTHTADLTVVGDYEASSFTMSSDGHGGTLITDAASSTASTNPIGTYDTSGTINVADTDTSGTQIASFTPDGSGYLGTFSIEASTESNGQALVAWGFDLGNDQINLASGQTLTQSYNVSLSEPEGQAANQNVSISIGGPGNDTFVFQPGVGADTIVNFNAQNDTIDLHNFSDIHSVQQLEAAITTDTHGDAVIALGHGDSVTIPGVTASYLQAHLQSLIHLA